MKTNENVKKGNIAKYIIPIILILAIIGIAGFAYARYVSRLNGQVTAQVANYNLNVTAGGTQNLNIDLANTRLQNDTTKVASGQVAPDTKGAFNLNVDATGSNVSLVYNIDLDLTNVPENLKFYSDSDMKNEVMVQDDTIKIEDCIGLNDTKTKTIALYWQWPYETGENDYEIRQNDAKDSAWNGHDIGIAVNVTGKQVEQQVTYLADSVSIGDYVNYDATSGSGANQSITPQEGKTGSSTLTTFNSSDITSWRVYDIDPVTKTVTLIAADPTESKLTLSGKDGWKYGVETLNSVGAIFGHGNGAYSGRSIQEKDIQKNTNFVQESYSNCQHSTNGTYDGYYYWTGNSNRIESQEYTSGTFILDNNSDVIATPISPVIMNQTYYEYPGNQIENIYKNLIVTKSSNNSENKNTFFVATRFKNLTPSSCNFCLRLVKDGRVDYSGLFFPTGYSVAPKYAVMPMVTLQSNIRVTGQDSNSGVWQLDL